jgi:hypothetical protein
MGGGHFLSAYLSDPSNKSKLKPFFSAQKANNRLMPLGCFLNMKPHTQNFKCILCFTTFSGTNDVLQRDERFKITCLDVFFLQSLKQCRKKMAREAEAARGDIQIWPYKKVHSFTDK